MIAKHISFGTGAFTKSYCLNDFIILQARGHFKFVASP